MKKIWLSLPPIIIVSYIAIILVALKFVNPNQISNELKNSLVQAFVSEDEEIEISQPKITYTPSPGIWLERIKSPTKFNSYSVKLNFSWLSLLIFSPTVDSISVESITTHESLFFDTGSMHNLLPNLKDFSNKKTSVDKFKIKNFYVLTSASSSSKNLSYDYYKNLYISKQPGKVNFNTGYVGGGFDVKGQFEFFDSEEMKLNINIKGKDYTAKIKASGDIYEYDGEAKVEISKLGDFLNENFNDLDLMLTHVKSNESASIKANLKVKQDGYALPEIKIDSPSIKASGSYTPGDDTKARDFYLSVKNFDLDNLLNTKSKIYRKPQHRYKIYFSREAEASFEVKMDKLVYSGKELQDITSKGKLKDGELAIDNLVLHDGDTSKLEVSGRLSQNNYRSVFIGGLNLESKDLNQLIGDFYDSSFKTEEKFSGNYSSELRMTPREFSLENIRARFGLASVEGNLSMKYIGSTPRVQGDLGLSGLQLDEKNYPLISPAYKYLISLGSDFDSSDYIKKYQPLRNFPYLASINLDIDNIITDNSKLEYLSALINLEPAKLQVDNINLTHKNNNIGGSAKVTVGELKPYFETKVTFDKVDLSGYNFSELLEFRDSFLSRINLNKISLKTKAHINDLKWFSGSNIELKNLGLGGAFEDNNFKLNSFSAKLNGADIESSGNIQLSPLDLSLVYTLSGVDLAKFSKKFLPEKLFAGGKANASGSLATRGETPEQLFNSLRAENSVIAKAVLLNNFNIDDLIVSYKDNEISINSTPDEIDKILNSGKLIIAELDSKFKLNNSKIETNNLSFSTRQSKASGDLNLNLGNYDIDGDVKFNFKESRNKNAANIEFPINISGNMFSPKINYDLDNLDKLRNRNIRRLNRR